MRQLDKQICRQTGFRYDEDPNENDAHDEDRDEDDYNDPVTSQLHSLG